jgi:hypothetical protein
MGILASLGGAANRRGTAAETSTRPTAAAGAGTSDRRSGEQSRNQGQEEPESSG